jgi:heme exporter protein D
MMPDLDRYAATVLAAYGVTLAILALLVAWSWWRSVRVRRALAEAEALRHGRTDGAAQT